MCRFFAYISPEEPCLLSDVLITPANSISKQCSEHYLPHLLPHGEETDLDDSKDRLIKMRNSLLNMDGVGICWYTPAASNYILHLAGPRPALYKSQSPPINDFNFRSLCENTETRCLFAHIRASSGSVVTPVNNRECPVHVTLEPPAESYHRSICIWSARFHAQWRRVRLPRDPA
jgi:glutamine amidotransferase